VRGFWAAIAAFLTAGLLVGVVAAGVFALIAAVVQGGLTQSFDESALRWLAARRSPGLDDIMLEITTLGDGMVLIMIVAITSVFLWVTKHHWSVYILLVAMFGGKLLNTLLKAAFDRSRPSVVDLIDRVSSPSFPSGHAMGAFITYGTVAYLLARLGPTRRLRRTIWVVTALIVCAIGGSRMYLGVHYPSDVVAGFIAGLAWIAFVASSVTALQFFAPRRPATEAEERDLHTTPAATVAAPSQDT
jgi:undecaprenyl-diphosphatase